MAYKIKYQRDAKEELDKCLATYAPTALPGRLTKWLGELASEAESREWALSLDLATMLENMDGMEQMVRHWPTVWQKLWNASMIEKIKAAAIVVVKRKPPYECRGSDRTFKMFLKSVTVTTLYSIDHVKHEIVFLSFDGLPMQDYD